MKMENNRNDESMGSRKMPFSRELYIDSADFMKVPTKIHIITHIVIIIPIIKSIVNIKAIIPKIGRAHV